MRKIKYLFSIAVIAFLCSVSVFAYEADSFDDYASYTAQMVFSAQSETCMPASLSAKSRFDCKRLMAEFSSDAYIPNGINPRDCVLYENIAVYSFHTAAAAEKAYAVLIKLPDVENVIIDSIITVGSVVKDVVPASRYDTVQAVLEANNWGLEAVHSSSYKRYVGAQSADEVLIGIVDTGLAESHPYFADSGRVVKGYNLTAPTSPVHDYDGHGTHVAGIVAAASSDNVKIKMYQIFNDKGTASNIILNNAILKAVQDGVDVLNLSLTTLCENGFCHSALDKAYEAGIIVVAASGNGDENNKAIPAADVCPGHYSEHIVTVGAVNSSMTADTYSNYGPEVDICAPGTGIYSTYYVEKSGQYAFATITGTSMAAPFVSAFAAMLKSVRRDLSFEEFLLEISEGALKPIGWDSENHGVGILDMMGGSPLIDNLNPHSVRFELNEETDEITFDLRLENSGEKSVDFLIYLSFCNESGIQTGSKIESCKIKGGRTTNYSVPLDNIPERTYCVKGYVWTDGMEPISMSREHTIYVK